MGGGRLLQEPPLEAPLRREAEEGRRSGGQARCRPPPPFSATAAAPRGQEKADTDTTARRTQHPE